MDEAVWTISRRPSGWELRAALEDKTCLLHLLPNGQPARWELAYDDPAFDHFGVERRAADAQSEVLAAYALAMADRLNPGVSNRIEAFEDARITEGRDGSVVASITGVTVHQGKTMAGVTLRCRMQPDVQVLGYSVEPTILQTVWDTQLEPLNVTAEETLLGMPARLKSGYLPGKEGVLTAEEALEKALDSIRTAYGETERSLKRFELVYGLNAEAKPNEWYFYLVGAAFGGLYSDGYEVEINAQTGEVLACYGMGEGNG